MGGNTRDGAEVIDLTKSTDSVKRESQRLEELLPSGKYLDVWKRTVDAYSHVTYYDLTVTLEVPFLGYDVLRQELAQQGTPIDYTEAKPGRSEFTGKEEGFSYSIIAKRRWWTGGERIMLHAELKKGHPSEDRIAGLLQVIKKYTEEYQRTIDGQKGSAEPQGQ